MEFAKMKCHGFVPELSYSPEPSSPIYSGKPVTGSHRLRQWAILSQAN